MYSQAAGQLRASVCSAAAACVWLASMHTRCTRPLLLLLLLLMMLPLVLTEPKLWPSSCMKELQVTGDHAMHRNQVRRCAALRCAALGPVLRRAPCKASIFTGHVLQPAVVSTC